MTREWQPNGSNYDYWRSDNPLIQGWWRFGDTPPKNNFQTPEEQTSTNYLSGLLVDSGPQKHHLLPYFITDTPEAIMEPTSGLAPWALDGSGVRFNWPNIANNDALYVPPENVIENYAVANETHGTLSHGTAMYSGFTVIGWCRPKRKVPAPNNDAQHIVGRSTQEGGLGNFVQWRLTYQEIANHSPPGDSIALGLVMVTGPPLILPNAGSTVVGAVISNDPGWFVDPSVNNEATPYFPGNSNEPFFFAAQIRREDVEENRSFTSNGSGQMTVWIGNAESGITGSSSVVFRGSDVTANYAGPGIGGNPLTFGCNSEGIRDGTTSNRHLPSGAELDEIVYVADGYLTQDQIAHYALSGMRYIETSNPESSGFVPEYPQSSGLVAYWGFDSDNGDNTAPDTLTDPRLNLSIPGTPSQMSFVDGIGGGRAIRVLGQQSILGTTGGLALRTSNGYPQIPAESGLSLLFPSGHTVDEGMTVIGWMRSVPTGTNLVGGGFGWFGRNGRHNNFFVESQNGGVGGNTNSLSVNALASGTGIGTLPSVRFTSRDSDATNAYGGNLGLSNSSSVADPEFDTGDDGWHLWAGVYDVKCGQMYMVRDAKTVIQMTQQISSASGFASDGHDDGAGFFGFAPQNTRSVEFDSFAVYNRILSIPEMSGFGLANITTPAPGPVLSTPQKALVGYWPLDDFVNYDPLGVSGIRLDDHSWYSHHLTNTSGLFTLGARLNTEISSVSSGLNVSLSGSMMSLERVFHGANLDASTSNLFATSGFSAGAWVYLPSGDLGSEGHGSSGLDGDHMIMGAWSQVSTEQSWFLGIQDNKPHIKFRDSASLLTEFTSDNEVPFNSPFFIGCSVFSSGFSMRAQVVQAELGETTEVRYAVDSTFGTAGAIPQAVGASGFSILNAPSLDYGFPQTTRMGLAFMHLGYLDDGGWIRTKRGAVDDITLASGSVSATDPANISHWKFDRAGNKVLDFGQQNNTLLPINTDGHKVGVEGSVHSSGVVIRRQEYLDTLPSNPGSRRLDLGSGTQSWTMLTWVKPPVISSTDLHVIMNKGSGPSVSPTGIKVYTPADTLTPLALAASSDVTGQNGDLAPTEWNHLAVTYDQDNNEFGMIVNGRYAGTSFISLGEIEVNNSGLSLGGRGDQEGNALAGGSAFSGLLDDTMLFSRVLTLPEISGLAANSYNFNSNAGTINGAMGGFISGIPQNIVSGMIGSFMHGLGQDIDLFAGHVSGVSGVVGEYGGFIHGRAFASGLTGGFTHGIASQSGIFGHFMHGLGIVSGLLGSYTFGACQTLDEFDVTLTFEIVTSKDFDARLGVEKTEVYGFDSRLGVIRITQPPVCTLEMPAVGLIASGTPYTLTVEGSGIAQDDKKVSKTRFTFADFKKGEDGTLVDGVPFSGLYRASREFDTPGWYTVKIEVLDSYGYRTSCTRPFLLVPSGSTSGAYLATLPGVSISGTPQTGSAIQRVFFTHSLSGLDTTSGLLEYTDFSDQQESLVNSLEVPSGTQFVDFVRTHDYTMPGRYSPVWAVSGSWGIVSDSLSDGIDYLG